VYLEAEAVLSIISRCEGDWVLLSSAAIDLELSKIVDEGRRECVDMLYATAGERARVTEQTEQRAQHFQQNGVRPFDALHLAVAEAANADVFLTTDDRLLRTARNLGITITMANPVTWLMEVTKDEK